MSKTLKNIVIILILATVLYAGYYLYVQKESTTLNSNTNDPLLSDSLSKTQVFIERRQQLDAMSPDITFFTDDRFLSLHGYTEPVEDQPVGRPNPFATPGGGL